MDLSQKLRPEVVAEAKSLVTHRRHLHQYPEIGFECHDTAKYVKAILESYGYTVKDGIATTGLVAVLEGAHPGPCIGLRSDMDALPMQEEETHEYVSKNPGKAHMCGHDAHMSMLLIAAKVLASMKDKIHGQVKFIFQPAEEGGSGGKVMVEQGALKNPDVQEIYGIHVWNPNKPGEVGIKSGPVMANSDRFYMTIKGQGGHGGSPDTSRDPIVAGAQLVLALQSIISRNVSPYQSAVLSVTQFHSGTAGNVIPATAEIMGTIRTYTPETKALLTKRMEEVCQGIEKVHQVSITFQLADGYPAVVNTPKETERVREAAIKIVGEKGVVDPTLFMGGEDFAFFLQEVPGCFFFVGSHPAKATEFLPHHHPKFDIQEEPTMLIGASIWVQLIDDLLIPK